MELSSSTVDCGNLLDAAMVPTAMVEGQAHLVRYANPAFCKLVGRSMDTVEGSTLAACFPRYLECVDLLHKVETSGQADSQTEQDYVSPDRNGWSYAAWPIRSAPGSSFRTMLQISDTSEYRQQVTAINQALIVSAVRQHELAEEADRLSLQMQQEILERKRSQEAFQRSEARLVLALDSAKASTWEWDFTSGMLQLRDREQPTAAAEIRRCRYGSWRALVVPEDRPATDAATILMADGSVEVNVEFRLRSKANITRWVLARGSRTRVESGASLLYSGIFLDITERKYAEEVLLRSEKLAGVGRLAATLAHEINNPLDAAINCIYIAKTDPGVPNAARAFLETADEELRRVTHMTRQSLGFYREATVPTVFNVNLVIESVVQLLSNRIKAKSAHVVLHLAESPLVDGIFGELRQVFVNLVANSLDAIEPFGTIALKTSVGVNPRGKACRVRITVADCGKGMSHAQAARIFEPFFTTKGELGTGLGLWVTKQIVEQHRGTVSVRSRVGESQHGTTFSVTLPCPVSTS